MAEVPSALCGVCADNTNLLLECIECTNCKGVYHLDCYSQRYTAIVNYEQWLCINCTYVSDEEECFSSLRAVNLFLNYVYFQKRAIIIGSLTQMRQTLTKTILLMYSGIVHILL